MARADLMTNLVPIGLGAGAGVGVTWVDSAISKSLTKDDHDKGTLPKDVAMWRKAYAVDLALGVVGAALGYWMVKNDSLRKGIYSGSGVLVFNGLKDLALDLTAEDCNRTLTGRAKESWDVQDPCPAGQARRLAMGQARFANATRLPSSMSVNTEAPRRSPASLF